MFMVTGSNDGLGFEASVHLAQMRLKLLLATSRDLLKSFEAILERTDAGHVTGFSTTNVAAYHSTLLPLKVYAPLLRGSRQNGVEPERAHRQRKVCFPDYVQTQDGWESISQVNYLSTALLSLLLLPHLVNASATMDAVPRLVIVSSLGHYLSSLALNSSDTWNNILDTVNDPQLVPGLSFLPRMHDNRLTGPICYNLTKLFGMIFSGSSQRVYQIQLPSSHATANPGYCDVT
ncbi:hypothetical protein JVU11DRAFT_4439 [Chiua virens]|nr:hypothetical protein JVU11DRAFT_4439 [Chiua virens]